MTGAGPATGGDDRFLGLPPRGWVRFAITIFGGWGRLPGVAALVP